MNVLHVTASLSSEAGGVATSLQGLAPALAEEDIHCEIFTVRREGSGPSVIPSSQVPIQQFEPGFLAYFWNAYSKRLTTAIWDRLEAHTFDLVHVHEPWHYPGFVAFRAARSHNVPYVLTPHGTLDEWCLQHRAFKKRIYMRMIQGNILKSSDRLHALTHAEMAQISALGYDTPVFVAPNGIDSAPFENSPERSRFLAAYPGLSGKRVILFLGRLHAKKGLNVLARSYVSLSHKFKDVALLVVGPDENHVQKRMEAILKTSRNPCSIVFTGVLTGKEKLEAFACADLFVLPSYSEGFSMATLEAMAAGLPVVISPQCNFPEVSERGAGFVVEPNDTAVTAAIRTLLSDDRLRVRMGQNGRKLVKEKYSWRGAAASLADLYRTLVGARPR